MSKNFVIIVAAGSSIRMSGINKILTKINGYPLISWTLKVFINAKFINHIILVVKNSDIHKFNKLNLPKKISIVSGGSTRQESVAKGLEQIKNLLVKDSDIILVHDGARPLVKPKDINEIIRVTKKFGATILAAKSIDTIKEVENLTIKKTLERESIWLAQTPQAATYKNFKKAFQSAETENFAGTDEASLFEHAKIPVKIVPGENINIKITTKEDLKIVNSLLKTF